MQGKNRYRGFAGGTVLAPEKRAFRLNPHHTENIGVAEPQINV